MRICQARRLACDYVAIALSCCVLVALIWASVLERVDYERAEAERDAVRRNSNLVLAFEEHTIRTVKHVEQALQFVTHEFLEHPRQFDLRRMVAAGRFDFGVLTLIEVLDERGIGVANGVDGSDRDFFRFHRDNPSGGLFIGQPTTGRVSGKPSIHFAHRISKADGSFGGVAFGSVTPDYFSDFYQHVGIGHDGVVLLVGLDGVTRARRAGGVSSFGQDMRASSLFEALRSRPTGDIVTRGRTDPTRRYASYRTVRGYPLVVAVGSSVEETLASYRERQRAYLFGASVASALVVLLGLALALAASRREAARRERERSDARYRATVDQAAVGIAHCSPDGTLLKANRRLCEMLGYAEAELLGRNFLDLTHHEDRERAATVLRDFLTEPRAAESRLEKRSLRKDGTVIWEAISAALVRDAAGEPEYLVAMVQDITERKAAEAQLHEQLDELRRFQAVTIDRELRMEDLERELERLRKKAAA